MDFFDFLYRQYVPAKWAAWAERVWAKHCRDSGRTSDEDQFQTVVRAFEDGEMRVLRKHADTIHALKRVLNARRDELFDFGMNVEDQILFRYPV